VKGYREVMPALFRVPTIGAAGQAGNALRFALALFAGLAIGGCAANKQVAEQLLQPATPPLACGKGTPGAADCPPAASAVPPKTPPASWAPALAAAAQTPSSATDEPAKPKANPQELFVDFQPDSLTLSDREKAAIRETVTARAQSGWSRISISAARGSSGNQFDQAMVAQKRARVVNEIIPIQMIELVEFDPTLPEDTVRLEFKRPPAKS
jgi:hypothetical protein